ncbi:dUTP diphosphatase (plasmid) [Citricoccus nitrophenolicus]
MSETIIIPIYVAAPQMIPTYGKPGDAGADLRSRDNTMVPARSRALIPTGVTAAIPDGYALFIHPRSGLALKKGITVLNTPGTIDSGYRGEIGVILINTTDDDVDIDFGDRIAQAVVQKVETARWAVVDRLEDLGTTARGTGGYGSTGRG